MFFAIFFYPQDLEDTEHTDHDKSIFIAVMRTHEFSDPTTKIHNKDKKEEYTYHESFTIFACPIREDRVISSEVLGLEYGESSYNDNQKKCKYTGFWNTKYHILPDSLAESLFEHLECREEYNKESNPLNTRVFLKELRNISWCHYHEYDRYNESDHEIDDISMTCSCYCEDIVEAHRHIGYYDGLYRCPESRSSLLAFFMMLIGSDLTIELPYYIEEEYGSEELESRYLHEPYNTKREYDTQYSSTSYSVEYSLFAISTSESLGRHTDEDSVVTTHHEVYEDDIEKCE